MAAQTPRRIALLNDAAQPLVVVGPPRAMRGELRLQNSTERKVVLRQLQLRAAAPPRAKGARGPHPVPLPGHAVALRRVVVRAGEARHVSIALALDPATPPGTYHAELDVDGDQRNVLLHVVEDVAFSMSPRELVIPNQAGAKVEKAVVIENLGNVPLTVKTIGAVVLDEELAHCRALRGALADVGDTMKNLDDFAVALGRRYRAIYGTLALKVQNEKLTVEPGRTATLDLTITLPDKLEPRGRYTGYAAISTGALTFTIVPD